MSSTNKRKAWNESFPNRQSLASVVLLRDGAMNENKSIKTNVTFASAGLKLAGHLYTPDDDASPSLSSALPAVASRSRPRVCTRSGWPSGASSPLLSTRHIRAKAKASREG
jgi:hypothetical protein